MLSADASYLDELTRPLMFQFMHIADVTEPTIHANKIGRPVINGIYQGPTTVRDILPRDKLFFTLLSFRFVDESDWHLSIYERAGQM